MQGNNGALAFSSNGADEDVSMTFEVQMKRGSRAFPSMGHRRKRVLALPLLCAFSGMHVACSNVLDQPIVVRLRSHTVESGRCATSWRVLSCTANVTSRSVFHDVGSWYLDVKVDLPSSLGGVRVLRGTLDEHLRRFRSMGVHDATARCGGFNWQLRAADDDPHDIHILRDGGVVARIRVE